jgi:GR25 family glycosyltransferase involved in LPS biosynthesis
MFNWRNCYTTYINLDHRKDRRDHMEKELSRVGISAIRSGGMLIDECISKYGEEKIKTMRGRHVGAVGCHYSQVRAMENALNCGKDAFIMEDDLVFSSDVISRLDHAQNFLNNNEWDVFWLGGTYFLESPVWHGIGHTYKDLRECKCSLGKDAETTSDKRIMRTYGCWSTYAYIVNKNSLERILNLLDENVSSSYAIDFLFIKLQPWLKTFAFNPGMVKQIDGDSDISGGKRIFSDFSSLGPHWFSDIIE